MSQAFWKNKSMPEMSTEEWESLCDGCARCCLHKLEDEDSADVYYTAVVCRFLDQDRCACTGYADRTRLVPDCVQLTPARALDYSWLPRTCAYRMVAEGRDLQWWHPLVSGSSDTVHEAGISVRGKCTSELYVHPDSLKEQIVTWIET